MRAIATLVVVIALTAAANGTSQTRATAGATPQILSEQDLVPDFRNDPGLATVRIAKMADGRQRLRMTYGSRRRMGAAMFLVMADLVSGTYRAFRVTGHPLADPRVRQYLNELRPRLEADGRWTFNESMQPQSGSVTLQELAQRVQAAEPPPICQSCQSICDGNAITEGYTWDPAFIQLTKTYINVSWSRNDSPRGCVWNKSGFGSCWAANPSPVGTHWFVDTCPARLIQGAELYAYGYQTATYYNTDFNVPVYRTDVTNSVWAQFSGMVTHGQDYYASGDGYWLLSATIAGADRNNCY